MDGIVLPIAAGANLVSGGVTGNCSSAHRARKGRRAQGDVSALPLPVGRRSERDFDLSANADAARAVGDGSGVKVGDPTIDEFYAANTDDRVEGDDPPAQRDRPQKRQVSG